jgi:hypothetical protein
METINAKMQYWNEESRKSWNTGIMGFENKKESFSLCDPILHYSNTPLLPI